VKITVDRDICQSHGRCAFVAPQVFRLSEELELDYDEKPDDSLRDEVQEAITACPTRAIRLEGPETDGL
jgi:ferredoxin